jgi:hypothetical protein
MRHHHSSPSTSTRGTSILIPPIDPSLQPLLALPAPSPSRATSTTAHGIPPEAAIEGPAASLAHTDGLSPPPTAGQLAVGVEGDDLRDHTSDGRAQPIETTSTHLPRIGLNHHLEQEGAIPLKDQLHATPPSLHQPPF